jgi:hypothetical protein
MSLKFKQTASYNAMYQMQYGDGANKNVGNAYNGFGMVLAWEWEGAHWYIGAFNNDGSHRYEGIINIAKLYSDYAL